MEDDILEYALNKGIEAAASKFNTSRENVKIIVQKFSQDTSHDKCSCEEAGWLGCINCDKGRNPRINIYQ